MRTVIAPTTSAVTSAPFTVTPEREIYIFADGLDGTETVTLQRQSPGGFVDVWCDGEQVILVADENIRMIEAPGTYRVVKSATAAPVAVSY